MDPDELEELEELVEGDDESIEDETITVDPQAIVQIEPSVKYQSIFDLIQQTVNMPLFYFDIFYEGDNQQVPPSSGNLVAGGGKYYSIKDLTSSYLVADFLSDELKQEYSQIINSPSIDVQDQLQTFVTKIGTELNSGQKTNRVSSGADEVLGVSINPVQLLVQYDKKKTKDGNPNFSNDGSSVSYDLVAFDIGDQNFKKIAEEGEQAALEAEGAEQAKQAQETIVNEGIIRTSSPAWGYTTDNDGYQTIIDENGKQKRVPAPFYKGEEYSSFNTLDESDIILLQQRLVQAGMSAPPVSQYGQWTDREANFMSIIFLKATDNGNARKDIANGLEGWETELKEVAEDFSANEAFINLLNKNNYGNQAPNVAPATIHQMLQIGAAANGSELSSKDLVDYAYVVINALQQEADSTKQFEDSLITDRDIILGSKFMDVRGIRDEGQMPRFFKGNNMPLVLPSYDYMTQGKGGPAPTVRSAQEIVNEQVGLLTKNQQAGNTKLADIKYTANLFEQSMGMLGYGDTP